LQEGQFYRNLALSEQHKQPKTNVETQPPFSFHRRPIKQPKHKA
jgi:hypothetical protein